jgi:hypothetical protein
VLANKSRHRIVTFRLSSDEYESVFFACQAEGARTVSEFARDSVLSRARRDGSGPQSIVKWLMAVTEELSQLSKQTAEIVPLIQSQQAASALSGAKDRPVTTAPLPGVDDRIGSDISELASTGNLQEKETQCG